MDKNKGFLKEQLHKHFDNVFEKSLINEIAKNSTYTTFVKDEMLIDIGDKVTHIPLILKGLVKVFREDKHEKEILLYFLEECDTCVISFINCIKQNKSIFRASVVEDVECILFPVNKIEEWITKYKTWRVFIIDNYHNRLMGMLDTISSLAFLNLEDLICKYLSKQVEVKKSYCIDITHQEIANDLHRSRVVISRLLKILEHEGKIKLGRHEINVSV